MLSINGPVKIEGSLVKKSDASQSQNLDIELKVQIVQLLNIHNKDFKLNRVKIFPLINEKLHLSHNKSSFTIDFSIEKLSGLIQSVDCKLFSISHSLEVQVPKGDINLKLPVILNDDL